MCQQLYLFPAIRCTARLWFIRYVYLAISWGYIIMQHMFMHLLAIGQVLNFKLDLLLVIGLTQLIYLQPFFDQVCICWGSFGLRSAIGGAFVYLQAFHCLVAQCIRFLAQPHMFMHLVARCTIMILELRYNLLSHHILCHYIHE